MTIWTRLSALHVFLFDDTAVVWRRGADADAIFVEYLIAIGAGVDDTRVGIAHDVDARGADETAAVARCQIGAGKRVKSTIAVAQNIFLNRSTLDRDGRNRRETF